MDDCCHGKLGELEALREKQKGTLIVVLVINALMFFVEVISGYLSHSTSLLADSLDMLGDALVYGMSIVAIQKNLKWNRRLSFFKGLMMMSFGLLVLGQAINRMFFQEGLPHVITMGGIGALAFLANVICAVLLLRYRHDDINMRSTWLCTRNDAIANLGVIVAAIAVKLTQSKMPDLVVGVVIASIVLWSAYGILKESWSNQQSH
jgi:cation diffusion facilitator family transporter